MTSTCLTFDAISEASPGPKWAARWARSWPAYEAWFVARGGDRGPPQHDCEAALTRYMPELLRAYQTLVMLAGGSDRAARFLSTWCPPTYLGGCSLAALSRDGAIRLVRNYDLSPDLNEGLLLRSEWAGRPVMGMVEFLWGLSDGINEAGLSIALAYGGRQVTGRGFGITTILRYVLETCDTVEQALQVLQRVPSHMPYNLVLADAGGTTASVEMIAGGGARILPMAIATNHQHDGSVPDRASFTRTFERAEHLKRIAGPATDPGDLATLFLKAPLRQDQFAEGFGTLFTAEYDPSARSLKLHWQDVDWRQDLAGFEEGTKTIRYATKGEILPYNFDTGGEIDWYTVGMRYASGNPPSWQSFASAWSRAN